MMRPAKTKARCLILGAGGHARVVLDCMEAGGQMEAAALVDSNPGLWGKEVFGIPVRGGDDVLERIAKEEGVSLFFVGLGSVKETTLRRKLYEKGVRAGLNAFALIHPRAVCSSRATIGKGTLVCAGAVLNPGVVLGENVVINTGSIVDHDCQVGSHAHIAPGAVLSGSVEVGEGVHIGVGATVIQKVKIGRNAVVGAGAVVLRDVPPETVVKGNPAR